MGNQQYVYMGVAVILILAVGVKWPQAAAWLLGLILVAALLSRSELLKAVIYGGGT